MENLNTRQKFKKNIALSFFLVLALMVILGMLPVMRGFAQQSTGSEQPAGSEQPVSAEQAEIAKFGLVAAAIAFGFGAIGAGIAIANVGAAAMGAIAEKPEIAGQALIFIALAEGLVVFGFITALMILGKV